VKWLKRIFGKARSTQTHSAELARNAEYVEGQLIDELDPELRKTLEQIARHDTPEARHKMLGLLKSTTLLVLSPDASTEPGPRRIERGETVNLAIAESTDGSDYVPAFTTPGLLHNYLQTGTLGYFPVDAIALMEMLEGSQTNIVLDSGAAHSVTIRYEEFEELLRYL